MSNIEPCDEFLYLSKFFSFCFFSPFPYIPSYEILPYEELYSYHIASPLFEAILVLFATGLAYVFSRAFRFFLED